MANPLENQAVPETQPETGPDASADNGTPNIPENLKGTELGERMARIKLRHREDSPRPEVSANPDEPVLPVKASIIKHRTKLPKKARRLEDEGIIDLKKAAAGDDS